MTDTQIALLPCPFDGGKAKLTGVRRGNYRREGTNYQALCNKCKARGPLVQDSPEKAAEAWNARAAASPQKEKFKPATPCECRACLKGKTVDSGMGFEIPVEMTRMIVCAKCGNKRCPHANDHRNACTNSNEPGQPGSAYQ